MLEVTLTQLIDDDLSPLLDRYKVLERVIMTDQVEPSDVAVFLQDVNDRFTALLDRIAK